MRRSIAKLVRRTPQVRQFVKTGMFGYAASLNGDVSSWGISGVAIVRGLIGYATPFDSKVGSWEDAGATVNNERYDHVTMRYSTAKFTRKTTQVKKLIMTGMFGYTASLNGDVS
jgi:hypothetical protein